ncbi:MAG TPA: Ca2+-dependent phosphoinositide-specific phospholipase C [Gemmatimonadaceae bacterium]|nr:Ca2+-dependent phosphoinositide-specific phospholipase C [Gemmatimonadaceae bacterium]
MMRDTPELYRTLRYDCAVFKEIHNTYSGDDNRWERTLERLASDEGAPPRGVELDLHQSVKTPFEWCVTHMGDYNDSADDCLRRYFDDLSEFAKAYPEHNPIHVLLDLKSSRGSGALLAQDLDPYILKSFDRKQLFTPADLCERGSGSVQKVATTYGWPFVSELVGRFIFSLSGDDEKKKLQYAKTTPSERLCFADQGYFTTPVRPPKDSDQIVVNCEYFDGPTVGKALEWVVKRPGLLTRGYYVDNPERWDSARKVAINLIAMEEVDDTQRVGEDDLPFGFVVRADLPDPR